MSPLFSAREIAQLKLSNRIVVSPMSQYFASEGVVNDWHRVHYGALANSGAGLVVVESTHVLPESRGTLGCLGLYNDEQEQEFSKLVALCRRVSPAARLGVQLNHSGRKASASLPWIGRGPLKNGDGAWETISASAIPFGNDWPLPKQATKEDLIRTKQAYAASAERAHRAGFDVLEIHAAHGYFLHSFFSPLSNKRTDEYGGSDLGGRLKYPLEVIQAVREVWPKGKPLGVKVSSSDWSPEGAGIEDAQEFVARLKKLGCDYVCMSSGGITADIVVPAKRGYQAGFAKAAKEVADEMSVWSVGLIYDPKEAEELIRAGNADFVAVARAFLHNPHWAWYAANRLGAEVERPAPYRRVAVGQWPGAAEV